MIALASFGTNQPGTILGTHWLVTYDQPLINGYLNHQPALKRRLQAMTVQLPDPFHQANLPEPATPDAVEQEWTSYSA